MVLRFPMTSWSILVDPFLMNRSESTAFQIPMSGKPDFSEIADKIAELVEGSVLIGHNVRQFDLPMLRNEFFRIGALPPEPKAVLDTLEIVRRLKLPRPHRLGAQCSRHGISLENAHTASADAAASLLLLWKLGLDTQVTSESH